MAAIKNRNGRNENPGAPPIATKRGIKRSFKRRNTDEFPLLSFARFDFGTLSNEAPYIAAYGPRPDSQAVGD
jgi:hypothetical protein